MVKFKIDNVKFEIMYEYCNSIYILINWMFFYIFKINVFIWILKFLKFCL